MFTLLENSVQIPSGDTDIVYNSIDVGTIILPQTVLMVVSVDNLVEFCSANLHYIDLGVAHTMHQEDDSMNDSVITGKH